VHYATWILSDEHYLAPPRELGVAAREAGCAEGEVLPGQMGRTMVIPWGGGVPGMESSDEESPSVSSEGEDGKRVLVEGRGGKCVIWH